MMKLADLTLAQATALRVLQEHPERYVRGGKRRSGHISAARVPHINTRAAESLTDLGLAKIRILAGARPFSSAYEFRVTDEGLRVSWSARQPEPDMLDDVQHVEAVAFMRALIEDPGNPVVIAGAEGWLVENHPPPTAYMAAMRASVGRAREGP